jgi:transposase
VVIPLLTIKPNPRYSYTITLLSDITSKYGYYIGEPRSFSNTSMDFFRFVVDLIDKKHLVDGDYFIVDNASIHHAIDISAQLSLLLNTFNIRLVFLPTYSPELNPCELVLHK